MIIDHEILQNRAETYLQSLIGVAAETDVVCDPQTPFGELGVNSFHVLKILKRLEQDFGVLPKTLLFENFNVRDLARYFVSTHTDVLRRKFADAAGTTPVKAAETTPALIAIRNLHRYPALQQLRRDIFDRYKNESSVSRGTQLIAPLLFFGSEQRGYFNCGRSKDILLAYGYTGPEDYFLPLTEQLYRYCGERGLQFNLFSGEPLPAIDGTTFSATPLGVMQRIVDLRSFTLEGKTMRRLRYQVAKFEKAGACRTEEYICGSDPRKAQAIAAIIDNWCAGRTMVNPLVRIVKDEIIAGTLDREHRLFVTYVDEVMQNVILISPLAGGVGYLMDLEFYGADMPAGGLEFAIVNIIQKLLAEGCSIYSLGGTYGCKINDGSSADPEIEKVLNDLRQQNIFNDAGNLQFKNKFRTQNSDIFLCRAADAGKADNVVDIIMMIADPSLQQADDVPTATAVAASRPAAPAVVQRSSMAPAAQPETFAVPGGGTRLQELAHAGFNPQNLAAEQVSFDLRTDSWAQLRLPAIERQMSKLFAQLHQPLDIHASLREIFPFSHFTLTESGRAAEDIFCQAWEKKGRVPQNVLFPSTIFHQLDKGFEPQEMPSQGMFDLHSVEPYKGNLHWQALQAEVERHAPEIAYVSIELANNAAGGGAVSLPHLKQVRALLQRHGIFLVLDATRVLENARVILDHDAEWRSASLWEVVSALLSQADVVIASLAKDFCVNKGGLIATNDPTLHEKLQALVQRDGKGLDLIDKKCIALALRNQKFVESQMRRRVDAVKSLSQSLAGQPVPIVQPAQSHCLLIDVKQLAEFRDLALPVESFVAWLYLATGIRAGAHSVGMQSHPALSHLVRLAIPIGLKDDDIQSLSCLLIEAFTHRRNIPDLSAADEAGKRPGDLHAKFKLDRYASPENGAAAAANSVPASTVAMTPEPAWRSDSRSGGRGELEPAMEIAIVGMAGRFPKARNLDEFWDNLMQGRDCISPLPESRFLRRRQRAVLGKYRGGFIDEIDRFDSLFFNISPREAETVDPQERLFLEVAWEALEDAGYYPEAFQGNDLGAHRVGVFVGAVWTTYQMVAAEERLTGSNAVANSFLWSIANRVSYFMNFSGPSIAVDTACSASLTAMHLACDAIRRGECTAAIVGGVNLDAHQCKQEITVAGGLLSEDGFCRAFGRGASGYVPGEGIGALLLKPLAQAQRDRDNIYAVIKSSAINHGGRNSGYSVPNPKAQGNVVLAALKKANIDARSLGYIEAHGTGTELGDPIEISGLNQAFRADKVALQSCPIGSIKTNIGHLEAAAGIAGVCKVSLQMRHRLLVPSLHSAELNEFIDFARSPFVVQQQLAPWQSKELDGVRQPLRAGVSSFGAGGSNAHVILEASEASSPELGAASVDEGVQIIPLSARNEDQLRQAASRLKVFLEKHRGSVLAPRLADITFTLQVGRKSFDHRVAILASSVDQLIEKLQCFVANTRDERIVSGHIKEGEGITRLLGRTEREAFIALIAKSRDPLKLAQLWIEGVLPDWQGLQADSRGRRISLPTYPFADKRHWLGAPVANELSSVAAGRAANKILHPLIDSNESTFERQLFRKVFTDEEFFIHDHLVSNIPTLPGVAYLDLARKAGELAARRKVRKIRNIIWVSPLTVRHAVPNEVFIELKPAGEAVSFEVFSEREPGGKQLYCQGKLQFVGTHDAAADEHIDLHAIRGRCNKVMDGEHAYPLFKSLGLDLGPGFQALRAVHRNPQVSFEVLGALELPALAELRFEEFLLHPSLVDASFQAAMGARLADAGGEMFVPYSLGEVEILHPLTPVCYSYVTEAAGDKKSSNLSKMDVLIVDDQGKVLVRVRDSVGVPLLDVHAKPAHGELHSTRAEVDGEGDFSTLYYSTQWQLVPAERAVARTGMETIVLFAPDTACHDMYRAQLSAREDDKSVLVAVYPGERYMQIDERTYHLNAGNREDFVQLLASLQRTFSTRLQVCFAWSALPVVDHTEPALDHGVYAFLGLCQAIIAQKCETDVRLRYVYFSTPGDSQPHNDAIQGFVTILRAESPRLSCQVLEFQQPQAAFDAQVVAALAREFGEDSKALAVRYRDGERYLRRIEPCSLETAKDTVIKHRGVYLITGGAGGLGLIFAEYLAKTFQARLVLSSRSTLKADTEAALNTLRDAGAEVLYVQADISSHDEVHKLVQVCKQKFGVLNGVIHSAGVLRDSYIRNKTRDEMHAVFAPKIHGTLLLDAATKDEPLDFFVTFSSLAALAGNAGQCDYSFANHFMDSFTARRNALARAGARHGKALSLNWSIWAEGGMRLDEQTSLFFKRNLGIKPLEREIGIRAFTLGLLADLSHVAVVQGVKAKIERAWGIGADEPASIVAAEKPVAVASNDDLTSTIQNALSQIVMEFLKLDAEDVDLDRILLDLGFDSIGLTTFSNAVNEKFGLDVTPVLFFEYPSIREIARHLATDHGAQVERALGSTATAEADRAGAIDAAPIAFKKKWSTDTLAPAQAATSSAFSMERRFIEKPIAIVGMSGVMPQADTMQEFWAKLSKAENDMVTPVPADRWSWEDVYGNPMLEKNKTLSKWGGFMREVDKFDPLFWGISPREAEMMDPQQRVFLETVWAAIEDSGHKVSDLAGTKTGLFVGAATRDYIDLMAMKQVDLDGYSASGTSHSVLVNRISFLLDLHGPSAPLDTACSSSLVALHRAIESIHTGSCEMAIVGGVQMMLTPAGHISFGAAGMLADDGKCKTFDARANGYVRGEGSGAIFIMPLEKALADGERIYAVIKSTAENHGGKATMLTAPNPNAQADLLIEAYEKAGVDPRSVGYLECHGTGTSLGDPIEVQAMKKAFADLYRRHGLPAPVKPHIGLTSVKTNIGHLETAAGIAGILKVLLSLQHKQIPALLHFEKLNPYINLDNTPFYPVAKTRDWEPILDDTGRPYPRRAGISSFGFGGANVHVVLEEYVEAEAPVQARPEGPYLIVLSAKREDRLKAYAERLLAHVSKEPDANLADIAYTLQIGRDAMSERVGLIVNTREELVERLQAFIAGDAAHDVKSGSVRRKSTIGAMDGNSIKQWLESRDLPALRDAWLKGQEPDWRALYVGYKVKRCSLPTYPFARERYWLAVNPAQQSVSSATQSVVHPVLHQNVSVVGQQSFVSRFSGREKFLRERCVRLDSGLPAFVLVEMARAAIQYSQPQQVKATQIELRALSWLHNEATAERDQIRVNVFPLAADQVEFAIVSAGTQMQETLLCEGTGHFTIAAEPNRIDLVQLKKLFRVERLDAAGFYDALSRGGPARNHLPSGISACYLGERQQLLEFKLPETADDPAASSDELIPLSLLSLAHLASLSLMSAQPTQALSLGRVQFFPGLDRQGYIWVRFARGVTEHSEQLVMDIDITDAGGRALIRMKALSFDNPAYADIQRQRGEEFESLLESLHDSTGALEFRSMLDKIYLDEIY